MSIGPLYGLLGKVSIQVFPIVQFSEYKFCTSLIKFIFKYFIIFDAIENLTSFLNYDLGWFIASIWKYNLFLYIDLVLCNLAELVYQS